MVPDAHVEGKMNPPTMSTADMAMIADPAYLEISKRFHENPDQLADAFAKAWFKLLHRDMGPAIRYVGPQAPDEEFLWQDNVPAQEGPMIGDAEIAELKSTILGSGLGDRPARADRMGVGVDLPSHRLPRWRQRRPDPPVADERMGRQRPVRCQLGDLEAR